jgi:beta-galactosidase
MSLRTTEPFNTDWTFHLGNHLPPEVIGHGNHNLIANETRIWQKAGNHSLSHPDNPYTRKWREVTLPHDFVIEGKFSSDAREGNGSLHGDEAWYVKRFDLSEEDADRRIHIEFDGVYRDCNVFCNGHFTGRHLSGYTSFGFDITEVCNFGGENAIAVRVDARENELWSYEGGGIYRDVRLVKTSPVHVPQWGVCIRTGTEKETVGKTTAEIQIANRKYEKTECKLHIQILDPDGTAVADTECTLSVDAMGQAAGKVCLEVNNPVRWDVDHPALYTLVADVLVNNVKMDRFEQRFGYRTIRFEAATGFYLNGRSLKLKGTCCHQDHGGVGIAVPPALQEWRIKQLKSFGSNALRTTHNPPDPALLDACDRLGMLVMDEVRLPGISREQMEDVESLIRRDRNHPSVILWSLGNEEMGIQHKPVGIRIFNRLQHLARTLDPTRLTTYGCNEDWINICDYQRENGLQFDVFGTNYRSGQRSDYYDEFHAKHPDWPMLGSETWGGTCTRGLYVNDDTPLGERWKADGWLDEKRYVSAYSNWCTPWGYTIEETWRDCVARPYMAGTFVWTGFDYRGEISPYAWPAVITRYGLLDICGFYKEITHYLRAWWKPEEPHIFLMPHWNWTPRETITVRCYANTAEVELFLNGESLGRRTMPENDRLEWNVEFMPGQLRAVGYGSDGTPITETIRTTAGEPASVNTSVEQIGDILIVSAAVVDANGVLCPKADNLVEFSAKGPLRLLGVGNGNPISHEPDQATNQRKAFNGLCQAVYQTTAIECEISINSSLASPAHTENHKV